eukprot:TRINITY_DN101446_c0_g1_i1.p1 TRINITY_DN101446_c0_g1~~TRINITY_DN101446_c0_g1_i1.p1  ORF type:complete len:198 (+),score=40.35 TRINITY_DN101446_c0_g1_i1:78-671(+)
MSKIHFQWFAAALTDEAKKGEAVKKATRTVFNQVLYIWLLAVRRSVHKEGKTIKTAITLPLAPKRLIEAFLGDWHCWMPGLPPSSVAKALHLVNLSVKKAELRTVVRAHLQKETKKLMDAALDCKGSLRLDMSNELQADIMKFGAPVREHATVESLVLGELKDFGYRAEPVCSCCGKSIAYGVPCRGRRSQVQVSWA